MSSTFGGLWTRRQVMIFIDWRHVIIGCIPLLLSILALVGLRYTGKISHPLFKATAWVFGLPVFLLGSLLFVLVLAGLGCSSYSAPIYSPSGKMAVRLETMDAGAVGGDTAATLHWAYGLRDSTIVAGSYMVIEPKDVHWVNDSELQIRYAGDGSIYKCESMANVKVKCLPR